MVWSRDSERWVAKLEKTRCKWERECEQNRSNPPSSKPGCLPLRIWTHTFFIVLEVRISCQCDKKNSISTCVRTRVKSLEFFDGRNGHTLRTDSNAAANGENTSYAIFSTVKDLVINCDPSSDIFTNGDYWHMGIVSIYCVPSLPFLLIQSDQVLQ